MGGEGCCSEPIRPCIGCNQGCYGYMVTIRPISCTVNPVVGFEYLSRPGGDVKDERELDVVVIGGGPAGMEAAIGFATAGHNVTLFEASPRLGGQVRLASMIEARAEMSDIVDHQALELDRLGVQIHLGQPADVESITALHPDVVVVATGSAPRQLSMPSDGSAVVLTPHDLLSDPAAVPTGADVVVIDETGHFSAYVPAEVLVDASNRVTLLTSKLHAGTALDPTSMETMLRRLGKKGVQFVTHSIPLRIQAGHLVIRDGLSERDPRSLAPPSSPSSVARCRTACSGSWREQDASMPG